MASHNSHNSSSIADKLAIALEEHKCLEQLLAKEYAEQAHDKDLMIQQVDALNNAIQQDHGSMNKEIDELERYTCVILDKATLIQHDIKLKRQKSGDMVSEANAQ